ncbi:hypothetical protein JQ582_39090 [Bradyrhizobium japonicum]|uniref:hypothetical protein n=1 Tax=Bradyrhizobium japonicum TaxID=375 RepID=UPI001BAC01FD|nr:hypothetical protein [Bradyrhizobium japonicum]MBR0749933.1 hypothetical protein [Bradyrhizobium japonicum]
MAMTNSTLMSSQMAKMVKDKRKKHPITFVKTTEGVDGQAQQIRIRQNYVSLSILLVPARAVIAGLPEPRCP